MPRAKNAPAQAGLEVVIRNIGKGSVVFVYRPMIFWGENEDGVVTAEGMPIVGGFTTADTRLQTKLAPGKECVLAKMPIYRPGDESGMFGKLTALIPGDYHVGADRIQLQISGVKGLYLGTGYLEIQMPAPEK